MLGLLRSSLIEYIMPWIPTVAIFDFPSDYNFLNHPVNQLNQHPKQALYHSSGSHSLSAYSVNAGRPRVSSQPSTTLSGSPVFHYHNLQPRHNRLNIFGSHSPSQRSANRPFSYLEYLRTSSCRTIGRADPAPYSIRSTAAEH